MKRLTQLVMLAACATCALPGQTAQPGTPTNQDLNIRAYIELLRSDVNKEKTQVMGEVMALDADQSAKFWPVYRDYQMALSKIGNGVARLINDYAANFDNMTDANADNLASRLFTLEQEREVLKKQYYERVKSAIGAIHAVRFLQVENQLERLVDLQIASSLPVVQREAAQ